jgi:hypothetical protein
MLHLLTATNNALTNVWADIVHNFLNEPYFLPSWLNVQIYQVFLVEMLPKLLEEIPLELT